MLISLNYYLLIFDVLFLSPGEKVLDISEENRRHISVLVSITRYGSKLAGKLIIPVA